MLRAILRGFAPTIAILHSDAKRNTMLNNTLQPTPKKGPGQKPLNRASYTVSPTSAQNHRCKSRTPFALDEPRGNSNSRPLALPGFVSVHRVHLEIFQIAKRQTRFVRRREHDFGGVTCIERFLPPRRTQAPTVAWLQPWEPKLQIGSRKIVPCRFREGQKFSREHDTNRVRPDVFRARVAATITEKAGHWRGATSRQLSAEHVFGLRQPDDAVCFCDANHGSTCFKPVLGRGTIVPARGLVQCPTNFSNAGRPPARPSL
jgi:hypothetical protein